MRWAAMILIFVLLLSFEKEENFVSFSLRLDGFSLEKTSEFSGPSELEFLNKYSGGEFSFISEDERFTYNLKDLEVENYIFTLPAGEYRLETKIPIASIYGQPGGSYNQTTDRVLVQ